MKRIELSFEGKRHVVWAERLDGDLWFHWQGRTRVVPETETQTRKARAASGGPGAHAGHIKAPMPGKVTQVKVAVGAQVKPGETLIVMEAMKMEYTLVADQTGKVAAIQCKAGDPVKLGQVLVQIEAAP